MARYRAWAAARGLLEGKLPDPATLADLLRPAEGQVRPPHERSRVEPVRDHVIALRQDGVEGQAIWHLLVEQHGFTGSYSARQAVLAAPGAARGPGDGPPGLRARARDGSLVRVLPVLR